MTEAEKVICRMYLDDGEIYPSCNEHKIIKQLIDNAPTEKTTNGEVIRSMFPDAEIFQKDEHGYKYWYVSNGIHSGDSWRISDEWWNSPYKANMSTEYNISDIIQTIRDRIESEPISTTLVNKDNTTDIMISLNDLMKILSELE